LKEQEGSQRLKYFFMKLQKLSWLLILIMGVFLIGFTSCEQDDILEKSPRTGLTDQNSIQTEADMIALVNACYDPLQWQTIQGAQSHMFPVMFQDIRADNCLSQWASFWTFGIPFDEFSLIQPNNPNILSMWRKWYTAVARANTAIALVGEFDKFETDGLRDRLIAEAKFIRGFAYFELAKHFGDVPLIVDYIESTNDQLVFPRSAQADVYAQVEQDLAEAAADLPQQFDGPDLGRATSGAAYTLLAKVHLYQEDYAKVREYTEIVINSNAYALEENFAANWDLNNEYGKESVFEIGYADGFTNFYFEAAGGETNQGSSSYQMFGYIFANTGSFGNAVPRQELIDLFDDTDTRKDATFIIPETVYEGVVQSCGCAVLDDCSPNWDSDQGLWVGTDIYNFFWTNPDALCSRATMRKYDIPSSVATSLLQLSSSPLNEKVLRYADVLLMHAEAAVNGAGGDGQASLDAIRTRAGLETIPLNLENVKLERRKELATEGWDRFTDLLRWGDAANALSFKGFQVGRDEFLPIPQSEIDLVGADILKQNPGY
jgi:hypothetical protein